MTLRAHEPFCCAGCNAPAEGKKKPCACATNVGVRVGSNGKKEQTWWAAKEPAPVLITDAMVNRAHGELSRLTDFDGDRPEIVRKVLEAAFASNGDPHE